MRRHVCPFSDFQRNEILCRSEFRPTRSELRGATAAGRRRVSVRSGLYDALRRSWSAWHPHRLIAPFGHRLFHGTGIAVRLCRNLVELLARLLGQSPAGCGQGIAELFRSAGADDGAGNKRLFEHPADRNLSRAAPETSSNSEKLRQDRLVLWMEELGRKRPVLGRAGDGEAVFPWPVFAGQIAAGKGRPNNHAETF